MPGACRARSLACEIKKHTSKVTTVTPVHPQWFYGFLRALPGDRAFLPPSSAEVTFRQLDASVGASGPHDFAVRLKRCSSRALSTSIASRANVHDDRDTPLLVGAERAGL
jgi:hypothetical protein